MKMKDVISVTGLTDRAIRLYIENGLVSPNCKESYAGRKNIDFTEEDVAELCNIAILRKAGFSINEIKLLRLDEESCRSVLTEFMQKTAERIENDREVLEKLEAVAESETVTFKKICESLNSVTKEKEVPKTDTELSFSEKLEKCFFTVLASAGIIYIFGCILYSVLVCKFNYDYLYPTIRNVDFYFFVKLLIVLFTVISCVYLLNTYHKKTLSTGRKKRLITSLTLSVISAFFCWLFFFCTLLTVFEPNVCSKTTNPKNYLLVDRGMAQGIKEFFPEKIDYYATKRAPYNELMIYFPDTYPDSTKYYYNYYVEEEDGDDYVEAYVEWTAIEKYKGSEDYKESYEEYKEKYLKLEYDRTATVKIKGDWQCVYYDDFSEENWDAYHYLYRIFAFNDKTETVRFIYVERESNRRATREFGSVIPKYTELEW